MLPNAKMLRAKTNKLVAADVEKARLERDAWLAGEPQRKADELVTLLRFAEAQIESAYKAKRTQTSVSLTKTLYPETSQAFVKKLKRKGYRVTVSVDQAEEWEESDYDSEPRPTGRYYQQTTFEIFW